MSLTYEQEENTRLELKSNYEKAKISIKQIALDLGTTEKYIQELFELKPKKLEDTWILKNYLIEKVKEKGLTPTPFSALKADYHIIWFLDSKYIDGKKIY